VQLVAARLPRARSCHPTPPVAAAPRLAAAAIARRVYINQGMGVGAFRRVFGGRSNKAGSVTPEHHAKAAGGIIRHALQQLEAMGLVEKNPATRGGRRITPEGQRQVRPRHGPPSDWAVCVPLLLEACLMAQPSNDEQLSA
jgi:hypothetical protein